MSTFLSHIASELEQLKSAGLYKSERVIPSTQPAEIEVAGGAKAPNFCANNYLGLADNEDLRDASTAALDRYLEVVYAFLQETKPDAEATVWFTRAAFSAAGLQEEAGRWNEAYNIYRRVSDSGVAALELAIQERK